MIRKHPVITVVVAGLLLVAAIILVWKTSINSANNTRLKAISARGEPITLAELDKFYKAVPDGSNAATVWLEGVAALTPEMVDITGEITIKRGTRLTEQQLQAAVDALKANTKALVLFRRAANLSQSRYPIVLNQMAFPSIQHLGDIKTAAQVLRTEAMIAADQINAEVAVESINCIFAAGQSLASEPLLISQLVRFAIDAIGVFTLEAVLNRISLAEIDLAALQAAVSEGDDPESIALGLIGERALFTAHLRDLEGYVAANAGGANVAVPNSAADVFFSPLISLTGFWERDMRFGIDALTTNIVFARLPDPERFLSVTNSEAIAERAKRGYYILSGLSLSGSSKILSRDANHRARVRTALVALAVERFRLASEDKLPSNLAALMPNYLNRVPVDPYDGKPVRYKRTDKGYVTYCIGPDEKDDGGTEKMPNAPKGAPEDVTFIVERAESR